MAKTSGTAGQAPPSARLHRYRGHKNVTPEVSARCRRSYRKVVYKAMAKLPIGDVPAICVSRPTWGAQLRARLARRATRGFSVALFLGLMLPAAFAAEQVVQTYLAPKVEAPPNAQLAQHPTPGVNPIFGTETFDTRPIAANTTAGFVTDFGTMGAITGTFGGVYSIQAANQYGGAGNTGRFATAHAGTPGFDIKLTHTAALPGINYFGLAISALNAGNTVTLKRAGLTVASYGPTDLIKAVKPCPDAANRYCGNPTTNANAGEQYAFVNFFDLSGYFDEVLLTETGGGFEADNYTVGYIDTAATFGINTVPEPGSAAIMAMALAAVAATVRLRRNQEQGAARA